MSNTRKNIISFIAGIVFAIIAYCCCLFFQDCMSTYMTSSETYGITIIIFLGAFVCCRVLLSDDIGGNDGGGDSYFDYTGGAGGIM